jgi:hypothetical protein
VGLVGASACITGGKFKLRFDCVTRLRYNEVFNTEFATRSSHPISITDLRTDPDSSKWRAIPTTLFLTALFLLFGGIQTGLVFAIQGPYARGVSWPVTLIGIFAFIMLLAGYLPIPFELIKRRGRVVGIDFVFLAIDWFGAFFSLMSLVTQTEFDALFGSLYALW